jgi:hypothetical protein
MLNEDLRELQRLIEKAKSLKVRLEMETEREAGYGEGIGFEVELGAGFPIDKDVYRRRGEGGLKWVPFYGARIRISTRTGSFTFTETI